MKKLKQYPVLLLFFGLLILFTVADLIYPDRQFSELENTTLPQSPPFSLSRLTSNQWTADYGDYVKAQFFFRDGWIDLQSRSESLLLRKVEVGGVLAGEVHDEPALFAKMFALKASEEAQLTKNISFVTEFVQKHPNTTFMLVPSASLIYQEDLPAHPPMADEGRMLDEIFAQVGQHGSVMDLRGLLDAHKDEYIFYRTDHHWTTHGAYLAYSAYCERLGLEPFNAAAVQPVDVPEFYGTNYSSSRLWNAHGDVLTYYPLENQMTIYDTMGENSFKERVTCGLYDTDKLAVRDKYALFLYGNNALTRIEGNGQGKILVIKDSYGNCFSPFLTANFETVDVMDLRSYSYSLDALIQENQYDQILVLYNFQSFKSDGNLSALARPSALQ